jgi:hypothetical protein
VPEPASPYLDYLVSAFRRSLRRQQKAERTTAIGLNTTPIKRIVCGRALNVRAAASACPGGGRQDRMT